MAYEQPLALQIKSLHNRIRRLMERTAIVSNDANLTGMQYAILGYLSEQGDAADVFQRDVESEFNIRRSTATGMLKLLEKDGFINRVGVPGDLRLKKIVRTEKATELDVAARAHMKKMEAKLARGISRSELDVFYSVLRKISENAQD
jgi:DNA-binding MarR family transcriptional regulator